MIDYQYLLGAVVLLLLALLGLHAIGGNRRHKEGNATMIKRAVVGIIASIVTRVLLQDSGLGTSDITLWSVSVGLGLAIAIVYKG